MTSRQILAGIITLMLLSACSRPAPPPPDRKPLAQQAPGAFERVTFQAGDIFADISDRGVYFLDTATGEGEGWIPPGDGPLSVTDDNRFVIADGGYLVDRKTRTVWKWDPDQYRLLLASGEGFLFAEMGRSEGTEQPRETGRLIWTAPDMTPRQTVDVDLKSATSLQALLAPDGRRVALLYRDPLQVILVELESGAVVKLDQPAAALKSAGEMLELYQKVDSQHSRILWYTWEGQRVRQMDIPGRNPIVSPDGQWVAWTELTAEGKPVIVIADADGLNPRAQVPEASTCFPDVGTDGTRWLSDSSGLVINTPSGYRILTVSGELQAPPAFTGLAWYEEPQPAPDDPDRFAVGRLVVTNRDGTLKQGVAVDHMEVTPDRMAPWGSSSDELRFVVQGSGRGPICGAESFLGQE